jgi:trehalose 6-phosphate phosphatase
MLVRGAREALDALAARFGIVAVVSGRALEDLRKRVGTGGVLLAGAYGRERSDRTVRRATEGWETVAFAARARIDGLGGVQIERKGAGIAIHFRAAPEHGEVVRTIADELAKEFELQVRPGRMVVELVVPGPGKGDAILDLIAERGLLRVLVAGDDWGDLDAFIALRQHGHDAVIVAVSSEEAPPGLADQADLVVAGPPQLVALLAQLARDE